MRPGAQPFASSAGLMRSREDDPFPNLREVLAAEYADLPPEDIEALLARHGISAAAAEDFWGSLKNVASAVGGAVVKAAPTILPVAGTVLGTAFGGPLGGALGGTLGNLAGGAIASATGRPPPAAPGGGAPAGPLGGLLSAATGLLGGAAGGGAAGQLLGLVQRPEVQRALMSMALGSAGRQNIPVGPPGSSTPVPVSAFANLLGVLGNRAAAEFNAAVPAESVAVPAYLVNAQGEFRCDPAVPEQRAARLVELLQESDRMHLLARARGAAEAAPMRPPARRRGETSAEARMREQDELYDELELAEFYAEGDLH